MIKLPVMLVIFFLVAMFLIDVTSPGYGFVIPGTDVIAIALFSSGITIITICGYSFRRARTTVNPVTPEKSSQLVISGMYNYSRNPMYIGFLFWLIAGVFYFSNIINLIFIPLFILTANKIYILPEEEALDKIFKQQYRDYKKRVRRWL